MSLQNAWPAFSCETTSCRRRRSPARPGSRRRAPGSAGRWRRERRGAARAAGRARPRRRRDCRRRRRSPRRRRLRRVPQRLAPPKQKPITAVVESASSRASKKRSTSSRSALTRSVDVDSASQIAFRDVQEPRCLAAEGVGRDDEAAQLVGERGRLPGSFGEAEEFVQQDENRQRTGGCVGRARSVRGSGGRRCREFGCWSTLQAACERRARWKAWWITPFARPQAACRPTASAVAASAEECEARHRPTSAVAAGAVAANEESKARSRPPSSSASLNEGVNFRW